MTLYGKSAVLDRVGKIFVRSDAGLAKQTAAIRQSDAEAAVAASQKL